MPPQRKREADQAAETSKYRRPRSARFGWSAPSRGGGGENLSPSIPETVRLGKTRGLEIKSF